MRAQHKEATRRYHKKTPHDMKCIPAGPPRARQEGGESEREREKKKGIERERERDRERERERETVSVKNSAEGELGTQWSGGDS